jgi:hypothetical protein
LASHLPAWKPEKGTIQSPTTHQYISTSHQKKPAYLILPVPVNTPGNNGFEVEVLEST